MGNINIAQRNYRIAVCDDQPEALSAIVQEVHRSLPAHLCEIRTYENSDALLASPVAFDIAFIDIELTDQNGISLAKALLHKTPACQILFISNYLSYAPDVYAVPHISFIYKPQMQETIPVYLKRAVQKLEEYRSRRLIIKNQTGFHTVNPYEISYLERNLRQTTIHFAGGRVTTAEKLSDLLQRLPQRQFCFAHRCYVVNLAQVQHFSYTQLTMENGFLLPVGRTYAADIKHRFLAWHEWIEYQKAEPDER